VRHAPLHIRVLREWTRHGVPGSSPYRLAKCILTYTLSMPTQTEFPLSRSWSSRGLWCVYNEIVSNTRQENSRHPKGNATTRADIDSVGLRFKAVWNKGFVVSSKYEVFGRLPDRFGIISDGERNKYDPVSALTRTMFGSRHRITRQALSSLQACNLRELRVTQITSVRRDDEHLCRRVYAVRQSDPSESSFSLDSRNDCDNLQ